MRFVLFVSPLPNQFIKSLVYLFLCSTSPSVVVPINKDMKPFHNAGSHLTIIPTIPRRLHIKMSDFAKAVVFGRDLQYLISSLFCFPHLCLDHLRQLHRQWLAVIRACLCPTEDLTEQPPLGSGTPLRRRR